MKKETVIALLVVVAFSVFSSSAFASLFVQPAKQGIIRLNLYPFTPAVLEKSIVLNNTYDRGLNITVDPSDSLAKIVEMEGERNFILGPNESRIVNYTITVREAGTYSGWIAVNSNRVSYQSDLLVIATATNILPEIFLVIIALAIIIPVSFFFVLKKKKGKRK